METAQRCTNKYYRYFRIILFYCIVFFFLVMNRVIVLLLVVTYYHYYILTHDEQFLEFLSLVVTYISAIWEEGIGSISILEKSEISLEKRESKYI